MPMRKLGDFFHEDSGQDLTEYALALAFVCLASAAIFLMLTPGVNFIWTTASATISNGSAVAGS